MTERRISDEQLAGLEQVWYGVPGQTADEVRELAADLRAARQETEQLRRHYGQLFKGSPDVLQRELCLSREENEQLRNRLAELERHAAQARADAGLNAAARDLLQRRIDAALTICGTGLAALLGRPRKKRVSVELVTSALLGGGSSD